MEKNEKIALTVVALLAVGQAVKLRIFRKKVEKFVLATAAFADAIYQDRVDEVFEQIVEDYDND